MNPRHSPTVLLFLCLLLAVNSHGQHIDTLEVNNRIREAEQTFKQGNFSEGLAQYQEIASYLDSTMTEAPEDISSQLQQTLGQIYRKAGKLSLEQFKDYSKAGDYFERALGIEKASKHPRTTEIVYFHNTLSDIHSQLGQFDTARHHIKELIALYEQDGREPDCQLAEYYLQLGRTFYFNNDLVQAQKWFEKALEISLSVTNNDECLGISYDRVGLIYDLEGDFDNALLYYQRALEEYRQSFGPTYIDIATTYNNLGCMYANMGGKVEKAEDYFAKAIDILALNQADELRIAGIEYNIAEMYSHSGEPYVAKALDYLFLALEKYKRNNIPDTHPELIRCYNVLGLTYRILGNFEQAYVYYQKIIDSFEDANSYSQDIYYPLHNMADTYAKEGKLNKAISYFYKAIEANAIDCQAYDDPEEMIQHCTFAFEEKMMRTLNELSNAYLQKSSSDTSSLEKAFNTFEQLLTISKRKKQQFVQPTSIVHWHKRYYDLYEKGLALAFKMYQRTGRKEYILKALNWIEESKSAVLQSIISKQEALQFSDIPQHLLALEDSLNSRMGTFKQLLIDEKFSSNDPDNIAIYNSELLKVTRSHDSLLTSIEQNYPAYYELSFGNELTSLSTIQQSLDNHTAILNYFVGDSHVFNIVITKEKVDFLQYSIDSSFYTLVASFYDHYAHPSSTQKDISSYQQLASQLSNILIPRDSTLEHMEELIIIPEGILGYIPFEALIQFEEDSLINDFRHLPYLITSYEISYDYALNVWINRLRRTASTPLTHSFLGFAPSYPTTWNDTHQHLGIFEAYRDSILPLPGAKQEIISAYNLYEGKIYLDEAATEFAFKSNKVRPAIIHLAMHAFIDDKEPLRSKLIFSQSNDSMEDGLLNVYEIYNMKFHSQLAVLSACQTGYGRILKGEGIMSLARAFTYAGISSILTSLWRAEDRSTSKLMELFYLHLHQGMNKRKALHEAKKRLLQESDKITSHPFYWANFVLIGDDQPILIGHSTYYIAIVLSVIAIVLIFLLIYRKLTNGKK